MTTKLTLRIDEELIQAAKAYASRRNTSVSQIVARYFELLSKENEQESVRESAEAYVLDLPPITASLWGMLEGKRVEIEDYQKHLEEKYL
ncbi:antitoxin [bacterium]|nr:antitoxin [bacterium]